MLPPLIPPQPGGPPRAPICHFQGNPALRFASAQASTPWPDYYNWGAGDPAWAEYAQAQYSNYVASYYGYGQPAPEPAPPGAAAAKTEGAPRGGAASRRRGSVLTLAG